MNERLKLSDSRVEVDIFDSKVFASGNKLNGKVFISGNETPLSTVGGTIGNLSDFQLSSASNDLYFECGTGGNDLYIAKEFFAPQRAILIRWTVGCGEIKHCYQQQKAVWQ